MMNPFDVFVLARTKLRSHRVRTGVTVGIAGLLFGLILATIIVVQGVFNSVDKYSDVGLNNRTIMAVSHFSQSTAFDEYQHMEDEAFVKEVEVAYKADVARKQTIAKKHSVMYDPAVSDPSPIGIDPITKRKVITGDGLSSTSVQLVAEKRRAAASKPFSVTEYLRSYKSITMRGEFDRVQPNSGALTYMKNGKENLSVSSNRAEDDLIGSTGSSLSLLDETVSKPFITNKNFDPSKGEIPVIIPVANAEKLLGLPRLSKDASPNERRERLRYVRTHVGEITAAFCYRNEASRMLAGQAVAQHDNLKRAAGNDDYMKPPIFYNAPDETSCSAVTVKEDTRTADMKRADANQVAFEKEVGTWVGEPMQHKVVVRGVGISGNPDMGSATLSVGSFVTSLLNSSLGYETWTIPKDLFDKVPASSKPAEVFDSQKAPGDPYGVMMTPTSYLVEFGDKTEARALMEKTGAFSGGGGDVSAYPFGSGTLFVDEMRTWVEQALFWVLLVVGAIAVIIFWGIIGRTVADSRRESAVFRAIGATRLDIASIYGTYAFLLSLRVVVFALALGIVVALALEILLSDSATLGAQLAYAAVDTNIKFHLFSLASWYIPVVIGVIVLIGFISSIVPIVLGARRNPITDMREDG